MGFALTVGRARYLRAAWDITAAGGIPCRRWSEGAGLRQARPRYRRRWARDCDGIVNYRKTAIGQAILSGPLLKRLVGTMLGLADWGAAMTAETSAR